MNDLTEKWKKGELENGTYYVRLNHDSSTIDVFDCGVWWNNAWHEITEVLEEVPSYEEWQKLLSDQLAKNEGEEINAELEERLKKTQELELELRRENAKLKELLKEVQSKIRYSTPTGIETFADLDDRLLGEINQVLGDKTDEQKS